MFSPDLVLFDFDGLLADTEPAHMAAYDDVFTLLGIPAKSNPAQWVGRSTRDILEEVIRQTGTPLSLEHIRAEKRKLLLKRLPNSPLMPHAYDVLRSFHGLFKLGLVTSSTSAEVGPIATRQGIDRFFDVRVFFDDVPRAKPFPDPYLAALQKAGLAAEAAVALEDSQRGVESAKAAGVFCIAVPNDFTRAQDFSAADRVAQDLRDAQQIILAMAERSPNVVSR